MEEHEHEALLFKGEPRSRDFVAPSKWVEQALAFVLCNVLVLVKATMYGSAFFPPSMARSLPPSLGMQLFLLATFASQTLLGAGSRLEHATGLMMCENIPLMNELANEISDTLTERGQGSHVLATVLFAYAASTVVVGIAFFALGWMRAGSLIGKIPAHYIDGCVGGIGIFVMQIGLQVSTGEEVRFSTLHELLRPPRLHMWALPAGLSLVLRVVQHCVRHPALMPAYFLAILFVANAASLALGSNPSEASASPWFFSSGSAPTSDWWLLWSLFDMRNVEWRVFAEPSVVLKLVAIVLFSLYHVPINVPALSALTGQPADLDHELKLHGASNVLSGLLGSLPNYLTFGNSAVYYKCGGGSRRYLVLMAVSFASLFVAGPSVVCLLPRCMAAALSLHVGFDMVVDSLFRSYFTLTQLEHGAVLLIAFVVTVSGMLQGLLLVAALSVLEYWRR